MNAKLEMKQVRDWLRQQRKLIDNDPHLADIRGKLTFRIVQWDARCHSCVIVVRNENLPQTNWNSHSTHWLRVHTWDLCWKWRLWQILNEMCHNVRNSND